MDTLRYYVALLLLSMGLPVILFWFSIHPLIRFWRALGVRLTMFLHYFAMFLMAVILFAASRPILAVDFGTNPILIGSGIILLAASILMHRRVSKQLRFRTMSGLLELAQEREEGSLLTEGIYARIRHPRFVQFLLGLAGYALICNFLATYVFLPVAALLLYLVVRLEEKELRDRFGEEYAAYCRRVPRFFPKRRC